MILIKKKNTFIDNADRNDNIDNDETITIKTNTIKSNNNKKKTCIPQPPSPKAGTGKSTKKVLEA